MFGKKTYDFIKNLRFAKNLVSVDCEKKQWKFQDEAVVTITGTFALRRKLNWFWQTRCVLCFCESVEKFNRVENVFKIEEG